MKKIILLLMFLYSYSLGINLTIEEKEYLKNNNEFTVCPRVNHYPISGVKGKSLVGITGDIFFKISEVLNVKFIPLKAESYDDLDFLILSGECDFVASIGKSSHLYENITTSKVLYKNIFGVLGNLNSFILDNKSEFPGHTFYVKDTVHLNALNNIYPKLNTVLVEDIDTIIEVVKKDKFSHYVNNIIILDRVIQQFGADKLKLNGILADVNASTTIGVNTDKNPEMLNIINKTLDHLGDKFIENTVQKYRLKQYVIEKNYNIYFIYLLIILLIIISIVVFYTKKISRLNEKLEEKVKLQTEDILQREQVLSEHVLFSKTDLKGVITEVSDVFCQLSGYTREELIGKPHNIVRDPDMSPDIFKELWESIKKGNTWRGEIKNRAKEGHHYWVEALVSPNYNKKGELIGYISIRHDITAKKSFEEQQHLLIEQSKMAAMGEMIGNIAHQWRQPLSTISTAASGIELYHSSDMLSDEKLKKLTTSIDDNAQYLSQTIEIFRNFMNNDKVLKEISIEQEIDQASNIISATLNNMHIELFDNVDYSKETKIQMVTNELSQALINILNNAKDILIEKQIEKPWVKMDMTHEKERLVLITVEDNGGGVPEDIVPRIFEPYFTTKHQSQGTGLGLHMSYRIIESLQGKIWVENTKNGAKFFIKIPLNN